MDSVFDIQIFADSVPKSSDATVSLLNKVLNQLGLKNYTKLKFGNKNDVNMHPLLNFIGNFLYKEAKDLDDDAKKRQTYVSSFATLITKSISIVDDAATIILKFKNSGSEKPEVGSYSSNIASIVNNIGLMGEAISKINKMKGNKNKGNSWLLPILTSSVALVFNGLTAIDGLSEEEYSKIQKSYLKFLQTAGTALVKNILSGDLVKDAAAGSSELFKNKAFAQTVTKTIGIFFTLANSAVTGIDKYKSTFKTYTDDGIPVDMAKHDAIINAIATVLHDLADYYTKGAADLIFTGTQNLVSWITGKQPKAFKNKNYIEVMAEMFKNFNFKNTGTSNGDYIISSENSQQVYGEGGGDEIRNFASNVTIYGGTGNDTVFSNHEWKNTKNPKDIDTFHSNSILGGKGDDVVVSYAVGDTIYGDSGSETIDASGKDKLIMYGTSNNSRAYGEKGDDYIAVFGAKKNWVNGGGGNDIIILDGAKNATVEYGAGDGNDIIYGYDESDRIQITKGKYQMSTVGSSIVLSVDNGKITLDGAYGKTININGKKIKTVEDKTNLIDLIATIPSVWDSDVKIIRGTSKSDNIRNITDDVIIEARSGNDTIKNGSLNSYGGNNISLSGGAGSDRIENWRGTNVTIDSGTGNDRIDSWGGSYVTIDGGDGYDTINNSSDHVKINCGVGNDSVENSGDKVTIDCSVGNDRFYNHAIWNNYTEKYEGGSQITINGGVGNDSIGNGDSYNNDHGGNYIVIDGGIGGDSIVNYCGSNVTIDSGAGNDTISSRGLDYSYISNVTINAGAGDDKIDNYYSEKVTINAGIGDDTVHNSSNSVTIIGGVGKDSIENHNGSNVTIDAGVGNDTINSYGDRVTISGGTGNDSIRNYGWNVTISGGTGNDTVHDSSCRLVTINGGIGNDIISLDYEKFYHTYKFFGYDDGNVIQYANGDGNDTVCGFSCWHVNDVLQITKGNYKVNTKGNDVIVKVGKGSITLKDAVGKQISIKNSKGNVTTKTYGSSTSALLAENNFVTADNLSDIVENNLTPTSLEKIETNNFENLTQENNLITYSEK